MVIILVVLTAVFDNVIIGLDIVGYDPQRILGIYIYKAPVEDFFYALLAVYVVPALWQYYGKQSEGK
jgi:lycopene cyclase domain-containing protein